VVRAAGEVAMVEQATFQAWRQHSPRAQLLACDWQRGISYAALWVEMAAAQV